MSARGFRFAFALLASLVGVDASAGPVVAAGDRGPAFGAFAVVIALTLYVTWRASKRNATTVDFYTAGGGLSGGRNGLAIAGDYLSAAAFLGVSGLIALYGYDGMLYLIGFFAAFVPVLLLVAEPCRNLGRYTFGDVLASRHDFRASKTVSALSSVTVAIFYMIPQIVGGAVLIDALVGVRYETSVLVVGTLMLVYVTFGGMHGTTWVQIIKAVLLLSACALLTALALAPFGFDLARFFAALGASPGLVDHLAKGRPVSPDEGRALVDAFFQPGLFLKNPLEQLSLGLALILGTAAMPHILMRFFSVPNAPAARKSVLWGMLAIGGCHLLIIVIGFAAAYYVGPLRVATTDKGGNLAAPLLAQILGGGPTSLAGNLFLGVVAAVAFATIVAVVAGLTLAAASAIAHDIYVGAVRRGVASDREQVVAAKIAALVVGLVAIGVSLLAKGQNVAQLVGLAFAVAASANLPALLGTLYWKRCNSTGVVLSVVGGTLCAIVLVLVSPNMQYPAAVRASASAALARANADVDRLKVATDVDRTSLAKAEGARDAATATLARLGDATTSLVGLEKPLIPLVNPGLVSIPFGFLLLVAGSLLGKRRSEPDARWRALVRRRESGLDESALAAP